MARHRLGHAEEARRWLAKAAERHLAISHALAEGGSGFSLEAAWPDFEITYAEAVTLLSPGKP